MMYKTSIPMQIFPVRSWRSFDLRNGIMDVFRLTIPEDICIRRMLPVPRYAPFFLS